MVQLNSKVDFLTKANAMLNPFNPKTGLVLIGDKGIEFQSEKAFGFIQIPWTSVTRVRVQMMFGGRYVRGFFIETNENQEFNFVVSEAREAIKAMRLYLEREQFISNHQNLMQFGKKK